MLGAKKLMACLVAGVVTFGPAVSAHAAEGKGQKHHRHHRHHRHHNGVQHHKKN